MIISIVLFIVIITAFLIYNNLKFDKTFLIKKGNHYSSAFLFKIYILFNGSKTFKFKINFSSDFRYNIGNNQLDTNKLVGIGFLPWHHVDSIRFGYRYNPTKDKVEIYGYSYVNKIRIIKEDEI